MKIIFLLIPAFFLYQEGLAQSGSISFERKQNMHKNLPPEEEKMKALVPPYTSESLVLYYNGDKTIIKPSGKEEKVKGPLEGQHNSFIIIGAEPLVKQIYVNHKERKKVIVRELGPKTYLIEDTLPTVQWKITNNAPQQILGMSCTKATAINEKGQLMEAWFTHAIPVPGGPDQYSGLPGIILKLSINGDEIVYTATGIGKEQKDTVKKPAKGKKVTQKEYNDLLEASFGAPPPGGVPVRRPFRG